ncbi:MAG: O-antigen ligase family protein [Nitrososphaerota archaeon]
MLFIPIISPYILNTLEKIKKLINIGILFSCIYSIYGILQFFKLDPFYFVQSAGERVFSFFINPNYFAPIILIFFYLSLNKVLFENEKIYLISLILNLTSIIFTQTFTTFLSLIISFPVYIFLSLKFFPEYKRKFIKFILIIVLFFIIISNFSIFFLNKYNQYLLKRYINLVTLKTRVYLWRDIGNMIKNEFGIKEYLIGIGGENLNKKFMPYKSSELERIEPDFLYDNAHNEYIDQFIKGGILQFISYILIIFYSLSILLSIIKRNGESKETSFFIFISLLAYSINLIGTYETFQMFLFLCFLLSIVNSLIILEFKNYLNFKFFNLFIILFLFLAFLNFNYHTYLKLYTDYINKGYNTLSFYEYIKEFEREDSLQYLKESERYLLKSQKFNPFDKTFVPYYLSKIYYLYAVELNDINYIYKSIKILNENLNITQYPNSYYNLMGKEYYYLKELEKAKDCYKKSIKWSKFYTEPILSLTKIYIDEINLNDAEKYIEIILSVKENAVAYRLKGIIYLKKGELEHAKKYLKRSIELGDKEAEKIIKSIDN